MRRFTVKTLTVAAGLALVAGIPALAADTGKPADAPLAGGAPARPTMTDEGPTLVTPTGASLYTYGPDDSTPGKSACTSVVVRDMADPTSGFGRYPLPGHTFLRSCAEVWQPYMADAGAQPTGEYSLIARPEGGKQWTYRGRPLYTSVRDLQPGDRNGGAVGDYGNRGWKLAVPTLNDYPPGLQLTRDGETLVLAAGSRPVFTPHGKAPANCRGCEELFVPVSAPALAAPNGDWSVVDAGAGRFQYAWKGKPLFTAPDSLTNREIARAGAWDEVVVRKLAGLPAEIKTHFTATGEVYTDKAGKTLYLFTCTSPGCDQPGGPAAYWTALCGDAKECARRWRPYPAAPGAKGVGEWSVIDATDPVFLEPTGGIYPKDAPHVKVWAYHGKPVYTYYEDKAPGDIWGNQLRWFALSTFNAVQVPGRSLYR